MNVYNNNQEDNEIDTSNKSDDSNDPDQIDKHNQNESTPMLEFVMFLEQDITLDQTNDNISNNVGFKTTHTSLNAINVNQKDSTLTVSGHVILNQVGSCTMRQNNSINGTSRQKNNTNFMCYCLWKSFSFTTTRSSSIPQILLYNRF